MKNLQNSLEVLVRLQRKHLFTLLILAVSLFISTQAGLAQTVVVRAVLFFSPTCSHCHHVIDEVLPPLSEQYGDQLEVVGIDITTDVGLALYKSAVEYFQIPDDRLGIPTMIVGNSVLWGEKEIPELFPNIIQNGIQSGGLDWPEIPGLHKVMSAIGYDSGAEANVNEMTKPEKPGWRSNFSKDPLGNSVAVVILFGMLASVIGVGYFFLKDRQSKILNWPNWVYPLLFVIGIIVAAYLSYIEVTKSEAVCGPVGDCRSVQESQYAYLFGVLPIGILGLVGYFAMLIAWLLQIFGPQTLRKSSAIAVWGMAWFGVLFSIYLTFLEPFVIGATCAWCITSAIVMTLLLWATTGPAMDAMKIDDEFYDNDDVNIDMAQDGDNEDKLDWESEAAGPQDIGF